MEKETTVIKIQLDRSMKAKATATAYIFSYCIILQVKPFCISCNKNKKKICILYILKSIHHILEFLFCPLLICFKTNFSAMYLQKEREKCSLVFIAYLTLFKFCNLCVHSIYALTHIISLCIQCSSCDNYILNQIQIHSISFLFLFL